MAVLRTCDDGWLGDALSVCASCACIAGRLSGWYVVSV